MQTIQLCAALRNAALVGLTLVAVAQPAQAADPARGQTLWNTPGSQGGMCSDCHGVTPNRDVKKIWNASGTSANQGVPSSIRNSSNREAEMREFAAWSDADIADLAAYINAVRYGKSITATPALSKEDCLYAWAESQYAGVFKAPALQSGSQGTLSYRLYSANNALNALGHDSAEGQTWVWAAALGLAAPAPLGVGLSAGLYASAQAAGCR